MKLHRRSALAAGLLLSILAASTCDGDTAAPAPAPTLTPRARLRISGAMQGRLEPCGCAGGQLGGLPRRVFFLRQQHEPELRIEGGNLVAGGTPLDVQKALTALTVLSMPGIDYRVLGLGPRDLELPLAELTQLLEVLPVPAVASDLLAPPGTAWPVKAWLEERAGDAMVRLASLTLAAPEGFELLAPETAWKRALAGVAEDTLRVLLVHGDPDLARAQAKLEPRPDLIVAVTEAVPEPPAQPEPVDGIPLVFPGTRGRMVLELLLTRTDGKPRVTRYAVERLAGSETAKDALDDRDTKLVLLDHRMQVQAQGLREQMAERQPTASGAAFVGSAACKDCHEDAYRIWEGTEHAKAWETLEEAARGARYGWPVTHYPDCVACHVVGYGLQTGFVNPEKTPLLRGVGCEQCHGPGSKHVASEGAEGTIERGGVESCLHCHDFEQSPDFRDKYAERWEKIKH